MTTEGDAAEKNWRNNNNDNGRMKENKISSLSSVKRHVIKKCLSVLRVSDTRIREEFYYLQESRLSIHTQVLDVDNSIHYVCMKSQRTCKTMLSAHVKGNMLGNSSSMTTKPLTCICRWNMFLFLWIGDGYQSSEEQTSRFTVQGII